jgi:hypothetical protein
MATITKRSTKPLAVRGLAALDKALFAAMQKLVCDFDPGVVVLDPISDLIGVGTA